MFLSSEVSVPALGLGLAQQVQAGCSGSAKGLMSTKSSSCRMGNAAAKLHGGRLFKNMGKVLKWGKQAVCSLVWSLLCLGQPQRDLCEQDSHCVPPVSPLWLLQLGVMAINKSNSSHQAAQLLWALLQDWPSPGEKVSSCSMHGSWKKRGAVGSLICHFQ